MQSPAYEMKKYKLSGSVGVGVDLSVFGTGISIEFEISLASSITETEFQEMYVDAALRLYRLYNNIGSVQQLISGFDKCH